MVQRLEKRLTEERELRRTALDAFKKLQAVNSEQAAKIREYEATIQRLSDQNKQLLVRAELASPSPCAARHSTRAAVSSAPFSQPLSTAIRSALSIPPKARSPVTPVTVPPRRETPILTEEYYEDEDEDDVDDDDSILGGYSTPEDAHRDTGYTQRPASAPPGSRRVGPNYEDVEDVNVTPTRGTGAGDVPIEVPSVDILKELIASELTRLGLRSHSTTTMQDEAAQQRLLSMSAGANDDALLRAAARTESHLRSGKIKLTPKPEQWDYQSPARKKGRRGRKTKPV